MGEWQSMKDAPRDGTPIQADIPGNGCDNVIAWLCGFLDESGEYCCCWVIVDDQEPPDDWDDGVCWAANADGLTSTPPVRWKHLPTEDKDNG